MICILRSELSAVPRPWLGVVLVAAEDEAAALSNDGDRSRLANVIDAVHHQAPEWALAVEGNDARFQSFGVPVCLAPPGSGIAGCLLAGLEWTASRGIETAWTLSVSGVRNAPTPDIAARLIGAVSGGRADMAIFSSNRCADPAFGLWPVNGRRALRRALLQSGPSAFETWVSRSRCALLDVP